MLPCDAQMAITPWWISKGKENAKNVDGLEAEANSKRVGDLPMGNLVAIKLGMIGFPFLFAGRMKVNLGDFFIGLVFRSVFCGNRNKLWCWKGRVNCRCGFLYVFFLQILIGIFCSGGFPFLVAKGILLIILSSSILLGVSSSISLSRE
jgi:hypothetical protein